MVFDPVVTNPGRLRILAALAREPETSQEFVQLRESTKLTDGNLATHAKRLESAGLVSIEKQLRAGRAVTTFHLTSQGREALRAHVEQLMRAIGGPVEDGVGLAPSQISAPPSPQAGAAWADDWID